MKNASVYPLLTFLAALLWCVPPASAQKIDSKGRDFWLTFPPNFHVNNGGADDSLFIFIVADEPTSGMIEYVDRQGRLSTRAFTITDITRIYTLGLHWSDYELRGFNNSGGILPNTDPNNQNEKVVRQSFHITSDKDIGVYAVEQSYFTSEAFLVLPTDVLGKEYFVVAYNSDGGPGGSGTGIGSSSTPSQFAIVATEDNTDITIYPKFPTRNNGMTVQNIVLQTGEVYLVQAQISAAAGYTNDLTGTRVVSTKPVALFGGHQRATLPVEEELLNSRDCLIEQIPPLTTWGKRYLLTPYPQPPLISSFGSDIYRILAAEDSTDVYLNGIKLTTLKKGGIYQGNLTAAGEITSPKPVLVVQYKKTSGEVQGSNDPREYSDPFMMILPPSEQFLPFYRFINAEGFDTGHPGGVYKDFQFATVITPKAAQASVRFDGQPVNQAWFRDIGASGFSYAQIKTVSGAHTVEADSGIGLLVYGYGAANSYGYVGGMSYREINKKMPDLILSNDCFGRKIIAPGVFDGGNRIASITLDPDVPVQNLNIALPNLPPTRDSAHFSVALQDPYRDGSCGILLTDTLGFLGKTKIDVCGYTVGIAAAGTTVAYVPDFYPINRGITTGRTKCVDLDLLNYGKCRTVIASVRTTAGAASVIDPISIPAQPVTLDGGQRLTLRLCLLAKTDGDYADTLMITTSCGVRRVAVLAIQARSDVNPPAITKTGDPCRTVFDVRVADSLDYDSGIEFAEVIDSVNCRVETGASTAESRGYRVTVIDPYQDAFFAVRARDSVGNTTIIRDTIPGFTMQLRSLPDVDPPTIDFGVAAAGLFRCDTLDVYNYGSFPLTLESMPLDVNIVFSIPPAQLPMTIPPRESRLLAVCYTPVLVRKENWFDTTGLPDRDALGISFRCLTKRIALKGTPADIFRQGDSRCQLPVYSVATKVAPHFYLEQGYPNPAAGIVRFGFDVPREADVRITLHSAAGAELAALVEGHFPEGHYIAGFTTDGLSPGVYFYRMTAGGEAFFRAVIVE